MKASHDAPHALENISAPGFAIQLPSAQLSDLIQINCINRIRGTFRVRSSGSEGHLFFDGGLLVHAECEAHVGLDAVVRMLGWSGGSIEPCTLPWSGENSIGMGADALLLHAAQRADERAHAAHGTKDATTKVVRRVSLPGDAAPAPRAEKAAAGAQPEPGPATASAAASATASAAASAIASAAALAAEPSPEPPRRASEHSGLSLASPLLVQGLSRLEVATVAANGDIQRLRAGASDDLADTGFFCHQLASLIGEGLGLGPCRALACESVKDGIVVFKGRAIVAARGNRKDLEVVLLKVGLA